MNSPISHLTEILQKVKESAQTFDSQLKVSESATRAALIDPVLRALGWDIANPGRVLVEKTQTVEKKQLRVDYALLRESEIRIVVEAKKLGGNLKEEFLQLVNYSFGLNVGSLFVTDGLLWHHYQHLSSNNQNPVREFNLALDNLPEVAAYFVQHMDAALISPETPKIDELNRRVEELENFIVQLKKQKSQGAGTSKTFPAIIVETTQEPIKKPVMAKGILESGDNWYALNDSEKHYSEKAVVITVEALRELAKISDQILPEIEKAMEAQFAERKVKAIKRRWIAQSQEAL
ncbi:MAG TPA: hypothetical protein VGB45_03535 [Abditibacterium sp.]|jgi:hypothetical protein